MSNNIPKIPNQKEYKDLTPFDLVLIQKFPFIEEDFDAINIYGIISKIKDCLNTVIANEQIVTENQENIYNSFVDLHNYVEDYFTNLDVQEEINNKLDEMYENGILQNILLNYANIIKIYNTTADLLNDTSLMNNQKVKSLGYYDINDGGGSEFYITNIEKNNKYQIPLENGLFAEMIIQNETINFRQLGAKPSSDFDVKPYFDIYENIVSKTGIQYTLFIPQGDWYSSAKQFTYKLGLKIVGCAGNLKGRDNQSTALYNFNENQEYLFKISNNNDYTIDFENLMTGYTLDNLVFQGSYTNSAIVIAGLMYSKIGNLHFRIIKKGHCLNISSSWEITFDKMYFRQIASMDSAIYFDKRYGINGVQPNVSALVFDYLSVENFNCSFIETHPDAWFVHCQFNIIDVERSFSTGTHYSTLPEGVLESDCRKIYLFKGFFSKTSINCINWNNTSPIYNYYDSTYSVFKALFSDDIDPNNEYFSQHNFNVNVNGLHCFGSGKVYLVSSHNSMRNAVLYFGMVDMQDNGEKIYDGENGILLFIGTMNNTMNTKQNLNTLMNKQFITTKSATSVSPLTLKEVDDAIDVTGCALVAKSSAPIYIPGVKYLKLKCKVIDSETGLQTSGKISLGYKLDPSDSFSFDNNILVNESGFTDINYDLSQLNNPVLITLREYTNKTLLIYAIDYVF